MGLIKKRLKEQEAQPAGKDFATACGARRSARKGYAKGGMVDSDAPMGSIADMIMGRHKKMAEGGMVDDDNIETPAHISPYDEDNMEATMKEIYDGSDDQIGPEPMDSDGDSEEDDEENKLDMVSAIRRKMRR